MVHVMQNENERRQHQHSLSFRRSLRNVASHDDEHSLRSSHTSSVLLEQMCANIVASDDGSDILGKSWDDGMLREAVLPRKDDGDDDHLATSLADLLLPSKTSFRDERVNKNYNEEASVPSTMMGTPLYRAANNGNITPATLKSIIRASPSKFQSKSFGITDSYTIDNHSPGPPPRRNVYTNSKNSPSASERPVCIPVKTNTQHQTVTCLVSTKDYDGERRKPNTKNDDQDSYQRSPYCPKKKKHGMETDIYQLLQRELEVDAHCKVNNMDWIETITPFRQGSYSGVVDRMLRPHGRGCWNPTGSLDDMELSGWWYQGSFIPDVYIKDKLKGDRKTRSKWNRVVVDKPLSVRTFPELPFCNAVDEEKQRACEPVEKPRSGGKHQERGNENYHPMHNPEKESCQYKLGELLRSRNHVIHRKEDEGRTHIRLISELKENDVAFIKRTDRSFTCAIVTKRYFDPKDNGQVLVFAVDEEHSKSIPEQKWNSCIRVERKQNQQEQQHHEDDGSSNALTSLKSPRCVKEEINHINRSFPHYLPQTRRYSRDMTSFHTSST